MTASGGLAGDVAKEVLRHMRSADGPSSEVVLYTEDVRVVEQEHTVEDELPTWYIKGGAS